MAKEVETYAGTPADSYIQSRLPADNGYGQNGYRGPSSDLPGEHTCTNFLPENACKVDKNYQQDEGWQTRKVSASPYPAGHGMKRRGGDGLIPTTNMRPVTKRIPK